MLLGCSLAAALSQRFGRSFFGLPFLLSFFFQLVPNKGTIRHPIYIRPKALQKV